MRLNSSAAALAATSILLATTSVAAQSIAETRTQVFDGVVKTVSEQFYDPAFHGVDWAAAQTRYRARLDQVANDAELQRLISQMLDELKSSHLYLARFDIAPGWSLTVPVAGHWSPAGENFNDKAVTPHELVPQTRADLCAGRDKGAERALAILGAG